MVNDNKKKSYMKIQTLFLNFIFKLFLTAGLLVIGTSANALDLFSPIKNLFSGDEGLVIWRAPGQYVKVVEQDWDRGKRRAPANAHPANLNVNEVAMVLASLRAVDPEGSSQASVPIFTVDEVSLLAGKLAEAFTKANSKQDVVFAVIDTHQALASNNRRSTAGRMFMLEGRLNIIFGDLLQLVDEIDDPGSGDISHFARPHSAGRRIEPVDLSVHVVAGPGIVYREVLGNARLDWVGIDISSAVAAYKGPQIPVAVDTTATPPAKAGAVPDDKAQLLQERRQMLEEMARLKKELKEKEGSDATAAGRQVGQEIPKGAAATGDSMANNTVEQRLTMLKSLYEKKLITSEEYEAKRKEILNDL